MRSIRNLLLAGVVTIALTAVGASAGWAFDLGALKDLVGGSKKDSGSSTSFTDLAKACESGAQSQRAACYQDAATKAKSGADVCDVQAATAKDSGMKKNFETCRDEGKRAANILQCIGDGASKGNKIDDLKKTCPATAGIKLG